MRQIYDVLIAPKSRFLFHPFLLHLSIIITSCALEILLIPQADFSLEDFPRSQAAFSLGDSHSPQASFSLEDFPSPQASFFLEEVATRKKNSPQRNKTESTLMPLLMLPVS